MKPKLAVFDFDCTIRDNDPNGDWQMGVGHLFPGGKLPEELQEIRQKQGTILNLGSSITGKTGHTYFGYNI